MVVKNRSFEYVYESDARETRSDEFRFLKNFLLVVIMLYLLSSIWIFFFIFFQAEWEQRSHIEVATESAAVETWKWWMVFVVVLSDIVAFYMLIVVFHEKPKSYYMYFSGLALFFSMVGICNVFLRGSIVAFVFPFTIGTHLILLWFLQRKEDEEHEITRGLRLRETTTLAKFLDD